MDMGGTGGGTAGGTGGTTGGCGGLGGTMDMGGTGGGTAGGGEDPSEERGGDLDKRGAVSVQLLGFVGLGHAVRSRPARSDSRT